MSTHYSKENLKEIASGDAEFVKVLAQTFLDEIPPDLESMKVAIENDNKELAYQFAHKMKPNLEMFGAGLEKDVTAIEAWSKTAKNRSTVSENINTIIKKLEAIFAELRKDFNL